jgi:hypothetical protein
MRFKLYRKGVLDRDAKSRARSSSGCANNSRRAASSAFEMTLRGGRNFRGGILTFVR